MLFLPCVTLQVRSNIYLGEPHVTVVLILPTFFLFFSWLVGLGDFLALRGINFRGVPVEGAVQVLALLGYMGHRVKGIRAPLVRVRFGIVARSCLPRFLGFCG